MIGWIRRHADPDELLVIIYAAVCLWRAAATWQDLVGKPRDAPHLQIAPHDRAWMWVACALVGTVGLLVPRGSRFRFWAHSPMGAGFMFSFVLASYTASWVTSWPIVDAILDDEIIKGDPHAWGSMPYYLLGLGWAIVLMLAPWDWTFLDRRTPRPGRLQKWGRKK